MILWAAIGSIIFTFCMSAVCTVILKGFAVRIGMLDRPAGHKAHARPTPLLGGSAIFTAIVLPAMFVLVMVHIWWARGVPAWVPAEIAAHIPGAHSRVGSGMGILIGAIVLHVVGLFDDKKAMGPIFKLIIQILVSAFAVVFCDVRVMTFAGAAVSITVSILWLVTIINAFNFLDNMDGLSAGIAAICAAALLGASASLGQVFVSAWLCLILGALLGFIPFNFAPASIYMGDSGSLVVGYMLAVVSCLTTYSQPQSASYVYGIFVPVILMAVPLYDMASVITLRIREGLNPMVGDHRHFSHRLLRRGMSSRAAVLTIYLCTAATAISASLLPHIATPTGVVLVFCQTLMILLIIALLESAKRI